MMKTLVFCTGYAEHEAVWDLRHAHWLKAVRNSELRFDQLLIVDDGSPALPAWKDLQIVREAEVAYPADLFSSAPALLYHHEHRLGRHGVFDFPGWHRSFAFAALYAEAHGFQKVIHLESDAYLISPRLQAHFNAFDEGWAALWNPRYTFAEIAIQIVAGREIANFAAFARRPYDEMRHKLHEAALPYTHIEKHFLGDRYGESSDVVPSHADFVAQARIDLPDNYRWWVQSQDARSKPSTLPTLAEARMPTRLVHPFTEAEFIGDWSHPEPGIRWMVGFDSRLYIAACQIKCDHRLELVLRPCIHPAAHESQQIFVLVNNVLVNEVVLFRSTTISCCIPESAINTDKTNCIRFLHPDAFIPSKFDSQNGDTRQLSVGLVELTLTPNAAPRAAAGVTTRRLPWRTGKV